jgi:cytoskeletal protein RodZ
VRSNSLLKEKAMFEKNRMTSKIILLALVVFFVTTVCHAQFSIGVPSDFSTTSTTKVGDQQDQTTSEKTSTNSTTTSTTASTDNSVESENSTVSDTNIDSTSDIDQDITSSTGAAGLTPAEQ